MNFMKHRFEIWSATQHPMKHSLADFSFTNPALPGVTNLEGTINWILAVLYPNTKSAVADLTALNALVGNTLNDYRVVLDDGDGKAASYRWEQREGEVSASWHKIYDMDWGSDSILAAYQNRTQDLYVHKRGYDDLDETGSVVAGIYAGQMVTGGLSASSNLTLRANAGDGTGSRTGYIQFEDQVRPTVNNTFDLGTGSYKFKDAYLSGSAYVGTMTLAGGSITDSSGAITFDNENLTTSGTLASGTHTISSDLILATGSITSASGAISFGNENLSTTGTISGASVTGTSNVYVSSAGNLMTLGAGSITSATGAISFGDENLSTTGNIAGAVVTANTQFVTGAISITGSGTVITSTGADLNFTATGGFGIVFNAAMYGTSGEFTGALKAGTIFEANASMYMSGVTNTIATYGADITLSPSTNILKINASARPTSDDARDLGTSLLRWKDLYLSGNISNGTDSISLATLLSLRNINSGATSGMTLFYNGTTWAASLPDTEVDHGTISGLSDDDHTQYMLLAGRSGGQALIGGTGATEHMTLESTANVSKGYIKTKDDFVPNTNASYSGGWSGTNLGGASNYFKDVYTKGEFLGFRLENKTSGTLPSPSAQNVGRVVFATDNLKAYVDTGTTFKVLGVSKSITDTSWNGADLSKNVTVSSDVSDARNCLWQLRDNANDFEILGVKITTPNASTVTITTTIALPSGTYRLIGVE
jgi:hypothetical protein